MTDTVAAPETTPENPPPAPVSGVWSTPLRLFGIGMAFLVLFVLAAIFAPVANIILMGFVFAFIFHAAARALERFMRGYRFATIVVYLLVALVGMAIVASLAAKLVGDARSLTGAVENAAASIQSGSPVEGISQDVATLLKDMGYTSVAQAAMNLLERLLDSISADLSSVIGVVGAVGVALLFAFMLQLTLYGSRKSALSWVPNPHRRDTWLLLAKMDQTWAGYLIAGVIFSSVLAALSFVQYSLMNVPFPLLLGILTGILTLIPSVGGLISTVLVFIVCIALGPTAPMNMDNLTYALAVAIVNAFITQGTYYFVGLPITGRGVRLPIAIVLIGSMAGLATGNLFFAWLTVPIIASLRIGFGYLMSKANGGDPFPGDTLPDGPSHGFLSQLLWPSVQGKQDS